MNIPLQRVAAAIAAQKGKAVGNEAKLALAELELMTLRQMLESAGIHAYAIPIPADLPTADVTPLGSETEKHIAAT